MRLDATEAVWLITDRFFREMSPQSLETVAIWYGIEQADRHLAIAVGLPEAYSQDCNFAIPAEELQRLSSQAIPAGLVVVAQLHSHPGGSTTHSTHDNENSVSFHPGFVSIVLPHYGRRGLDLTTAGVHECNGTTWRKLAPKENEGRVRRIATVLGDQT